MFVPFETLPDHSRLWIYQSKRKLTSSEIKVISDALTSFTNGWSAHGVPLVASFDIRYDRFIILAADEKAYAASGCSIDDAVRTMRDVGNALNVDLFDRTQIAFLQGLEVITVPMSELKKRHEDGTWTGQSVFINNLVSVKGDLDSGFLVPAGMSWLRRYLPNEKLVG